MTNTTKTGSLRPCTCRSFEAGTRTEVTGGDVDFTDVRTTGCTASTTRLFAQGHDAKLVSFLVAAELDGLEIALVDQGSSWGRAEDAARTISDALAIKAAAMVAVAGRRAAKKQARKVAKIPTAKTTPSAVAVEPTTPRVSDIKVGRWIYKLAQIDPTTGIATYSTKLGVRKTAQPGEYTEV